MGRKDLLRDPPNNRMNSREKRLFRYPRRRNRAVQSQFRSRAQPYLGLLTGVIGSMVDSPG